MQSVWMICPRGRDLYEGLGLNKASMSFKTLSLHLHQTNSVANCAVLCVELSISTTNYPRGSHARSFSGRLPRLSQEGQQTGKPLLASFIIHIYLGKQMGSLLCQQANFPP